jgi:hypothetical protein
MYLTDGGGGGGEEFKLKKLVEKLQYENVNPKGQVDPNIWRSG